MIFTVRIAWGVAYASVGTFVIILSTPIKENNNCKKINSNSNKTRYNNNSNMRLSVTSIVRDSDNLHFSGKQSANWQENNSNKNDNNNNINNVNNVNQ